MAGRCDLAARTHELTGFLVDVLGLGGDAMAAGFGGICAYHDGCSGLRGQCAQLCRNCASVGAGGPHLCGLTGEALSNAETAQLCVNYEAPAV